MATKLDTLLVQLSEARASYNREVNRFMDAMDAGFFTLADSIAPKLEELKGNITKLSRRYNTMTQEEAMQED